MKKKHLTVRQTLILFVFSILMISSLVTWLVSITLYHFRLVPAGLYIRLVPLISTLAFSVLVGTLTASRLSRYYLRPVNLLRDANEQVAKGDFSVRVPENGHGEVNMLLHSFNQMTKELGSMQVFRDDFIQCFSHEFKTPIVSIQGFAKQLQRDDLSDEERREYAAIIADESQRLVRLSSNVLRLSRLETQSSIVEHSPFQLDEQLRSCILLLEKQWSNKQLEMNVELEDVTFDGNYDLLSEAWLNLLNNAIKFTGVGGRIDVRLSREKGEAVVVIRDTGIGMSQKTLDHMFEKYFRGDTMEHFEGIGLGLPLVNRIIMLSGGTISAVSRENEGTAFTVRLRLAE